jgi:hypothetical protein
MTTISICAFVSLLSAASPTVSYQHQARARTNGGQSASQGVAQVDRMTRQGSINGRGQVWRASDVQVGSPRTVARSSTSAHSFLLAGK